MGIFEIIGPVMVGPSSSHTAGAVRIGYVSRKMLGETVQSAQIDLYGSFLATGSGHGTRNALLAGILGMLPDDERIPQSPAIAADQKISFAFGTADLRSGHPNTAVLTLTGVSGRVLRVAGESVGGGRINIASVDGLPANITGEYPTLIVHNLDQPGHVAEVTSMLSHKSVNIAAMRLYRAARGGHAVMILECDQEIPPESVAWVEHLEGVEKVTYFSTEDRV